VLNVNVLGNILEKQRIMHLLQMVIVKMRITTQAATMMALIVADFMLLKNIARIVHAKVYTL
jgi:hypothetical protein